jgi:transcriptional repressor NrdR
MRQIVVIKRSGAKRPFDPEKIKQSISTALRKRDLKNKTIDEIVSRVVNAVESTGQKEVQSRRIGNIIMEELAATDQVAYIRFASVYRDFSNAKDFAQFIAKLK